MDLFVADPEWRWWIILYFFFGGIAAGAYFTAILPLRGFFLRIQVAPNDQAT
jgi:formate-dependent nitrite reductase membrane component NrfD